MNNQKLFVLFAIAMILLVFVVDNIEAQKRHIADDNDGGRKRGRGKGHKHRKGRGHNKGQGGKPTDDLANKAQINAGAPAPPGIAKAGAPGGAPAAMPPAGAPMPPAGAPMPAAEAMPKV